MTLYRIELSFNAEQDIDDIALYTLKEYGQKQQDLYLSLIEQGFYTIAENPFIGRGHSDLSDNIQIWTVGKHIIVYTVNDKTDSICILRILHQSVDVKRYV
jgi:toxin ParE1/3/4